MEKVSDGKAVVAKPSARRDKSRSGSHSSEDRRSRKSSQSGSRSPVARDKRKLSGKPETSKLLAVKDGFDKRGGENVLLPAAPPSKKPRSDSVEDTPPKKKLREDPVQVNFS